MKKNIHNKFSYLDDEDKYNTRRKIAAGFMAGAALLGAGCSTAEETSPTKNNVATSIVESDSSTSILEKHRRGEEYDKQLEQLNKYAKQAADSIIEIGMMSHLGSDNNGAFIRPDKGLAGFGNKHQFQKEADFAGPQVFFYTDWYTPHVGEEVAKITFGLAKHSSSGNDLEFTSLGADFTANIDLVKEAVALQNEITADDISKLLHDDQTKLNYISMDQGFNVSVHYENPTDSHFSTTVRAASRHEYIQSDGIDFLEGPSDGLQVQPKDVGLNNTAALAKKMNEVIDTLQK